MCQARKERPYPIPRDGSKRIHEDFKLTWTFFYSIRKAFRKDPIELGTSVGKQINSLYPWRTHEPETYL
jgi:hypothetical protein